MTPERDDGRPATRLDHAVGGMLRRSPEVTRLCFLRDPRAGIAFCEWPISRAKDPSAEARGEKARWCSVVAIELFSSTPRTAPV